MLKGTVAIVGAPNVGKSTLFNRMIGKRQAITDDTPGLTRDRIYAEAEWLTVPFRLIDTGGIEVTKRPLQEQIRMQATIAIQEADVIIYLVDGRRGITADDLLVSSILFKSGKPIILGVNKIDDGQLLGDVNDYYRLGIGTPIAISTLHGIGIGDLLDSVIKQLPKNKSIPSYQGYTQFAVVGRPNVGKSSLVNAILQQDRVIVSPIEGTTRDAIDTSFQFEGTDYVMIDTAGLKKRGAIFESIDKYAAIRSLRAIERAQVVVVVINAEDGLLEQDKHIAGFAFQAFKGMVLVVNKWDLAKKGDRDMNQYTKKLRLLMPFLEFVPILYTSALKKTRLDDIIRTVKQVYEATQRRVPTARLNELLVDAQLMNQTPEFNGGRLRIYYGEQVTQNPPTFVLFCNKPTFMHFSYERFLENRLRESFDFTGTPIKIITRERK
ncbi:MAG: GTP-binding protein Der [Bacillota bacterium]|jgi:GTP-binding protein